MIRLRERERKTRFLILLIGCHLASILSKLTTEA